MRHIMLLAAVAMLVTACAAPAALVDARPEQISLADSNVAPWTAYREFNFETTTVEVSKSDVPKLREIVAYLESNPHLDIKIDGALDAEGLSPADRSLGQRRAASVRRALMDTGAGVASYKIMMEPFARSGQGRPGQVQVLVGRRTGSLKAAL